MRTTRFLPLALLAGATVAVSNCGDRSPLGVPQARLVDQLLLPGGGLLSCSRLPYDSVTQTIGPAGGRVRVGPHTLSVPPGALPGWVSITAVAPPDTVNRVRFEPHGLAFEQAASLTMSYANCGLLG